MQRSCPLLVFSDLDGTLLDHDTYAWNAARPALDRLQSIGAGVILASSKTAPEIRVLQQAMGLTAWPAIVENGAGVLTDAAPDPADYDTIRAVLAQAPHRARYTGFGDLDTAGIADLTGLPPDDAARARDRAFSEPGLWSGTDAEKQAFLDYLAQHGITAREGGRFLTLSMGKTKADQMQAIIAHYRPARTIALGDAPNDVEMLQAADHGVIVANPHRSPLPHLPGDDTGTITRTTHPGPTGWNQAVLALLETFDLIPNGHAHG